MLHLRCLTWLPLTLALGSAPVAGAEAFYRWTDAEGRAHLSDRPPPPGAERVQQLEAPSYAVPELRADDAPYSILNQLERLEASRERLARERREQHERDRDFHLRQRELTAREQLPPPAAGGPVYHYPGYRYPAPPIHGRPLPVQLPHRPGLWQPDHPAYRPYPPPAPRYRPQGRVTLGLQR